MLLWRRGAPRSTVRAAIDFTRVDPRYLAHGTGAALQAKMNRWNTSISPAAIGLAFVFSGLVGVFFGMWPARRAANLDPIAALRYDIEGAVPVREPPRFGSELLRDSVMER